VKPGINLAQSPGAVADPVFHFLAKFGKGLFKALGNKQRIVTEPTGAPRALDDSPLASTLENLRFQLHFASRNGTGRQTRQSYHTTKARGPLLQRRAVQQPQ
jgi:hypothetical protein